MWIEREKGNELKKTAAAFPVVALVGAHPVGKTSIPEPGTTAVPGWEGWPS